MATEHSSGRACSQAKAFLRSDTARSDIVQPDTVHLDTVRSDILQVDTVHSGTAVASHSTAAEVLHKAYSWRTWDSCADGGTGGRTEAAVASENLQDRRPYRCPELHQLLPVYSAQPADGGYSSCRLGN